MAGKPEATLAHQADALKAGDGRGSPELHARGDDPRTIDRQVRQASFSAVNTMPFRTATMVPCWLPSGNVPEGSWVCGPLESRRDEELH
jgi:hypothetical protein